MGDGSTEFEQWYREKHPGLVSSLVVIAGGDIALATDAADEAFARAFAHWRRVGKMASPIGWTYRTAVNILRRRYRRAGLEAIVLRSRPREHPHDVVSGDPDWSAEMWDVLRQLPTRERTAIALRYVADLPTDAIAYAMKVAPGTVGSTLHAARSRLARMLADPDATSAASGEATEEEPSRA